MCKCQWLTRIKLRISRLSINNEHFAINSSLFFFFFSSYYSAFSSLRKNVNCHHSSFSLSFFYTASYIFTSFSSVTLMNIFTQLATQFLINKNILVQLLQKLNFSKHFVDEFRNNNIYIDENRIRQRIRILCDITQDETFKDLFCHDNGIQLVFYTTPREYRFIQFRISFDIKIIEIILNNQEQSMQMLISNIKIKSLNHLSKPFRFCIQVQRRK